MKGVTLVAAVLCLAAAGLASPVPQGSSRDGRFFIPDIFPQVDITAEPIVFNPFNFLGLKGGNTFCPEGKTCILTLGSNFPKLGSSSSSTGHP